jgi:hypothetical protein
MSSFGSVDLSHRKRKRRRRQDKPAIAARLVLDDHVKGDVGILSEDLFADLFPNLQTGSLLPLSLSLYLLSRHVRVVRCLLILYPRA